MNATDAHLAGRLAPASGHLWSVHILRGLAAFLVVCEHIIGRPPYPEFNRLFGWLNDRGHFGVVCFFVISGFVLPRSLGPQYSPRQFGPFLMRRAVRIEPTYIASFLLAIATVFLLTRVAPRADPWSPSISLITQHLFYLVPFTQAEWILPVYWTLAVEFQFYLAVGLLYPAVLAAHRSSPALGYAAAAAFSLLAFLAPAVPELQLLRYSPYFAVGLLVDRQCHARLPLHWFASGLAAVTAVAILSGHEMDAWAVGLLTAITILLWRAAGPDGGRLQKLLVFLGTLSYSWYVIHQLAANLGETTARFLAELPSFPMQAIVVNTVPVATFAGSLLAAWILYKLVEKPTHELARRLRKNRATQA